MTILTQFLKFLIGAAPDVLPIVTKALQDWKDLDDQATRQLVREITPTKEKEIDNQIDAEADAARREAGLD